jgi:hypothetical protein
MGYSNDMMTRYGNIVGNISVLGGYYRIMASCSISQKPCWMKVITLHACFLVYLDLCKLTVLAFRRTKLHLPAHLPVSVITSKHG